MPGHMLYGYNENEKVNERIFIIRIDYKNR